MKNWSWCNHILKNRRSTQICQSWIIHNHLFADYLRINKKRKPKTMNHSPPRPCELSRISSIFDQLKHRELMSYPVYNLDLTPNDFILFPHDEAIDRCKNHILEVPSSQWQRLFGLFQTRTKVIMENILKNNKIVCND